MFSRFLRLFHPGKNSVRRRLLRDLVIVLILTTGAIVGGVYLIADQVRENIARSHIVETSRQVSNAFNAIFDPVVQTLRIARTWGEAQQLDLEQVEQLNLRFIPSLEQLPQVSGLLVASSLGQEYFLLRDGEQWLTRSLLPGREGSHAIWRRWAQPDGIIEQWSDDLEYDPRTRPWYRGATETQADGGVFWTEPYVFYTQQTAGITAATSWRSEQPGSATYVVAIDLLLSDVVRLIAGLRVREHGEAFLVNGDGAVFVPPRDDPPHRDRGDRGNFFSAEESLGSSAVRDGVVAWLRKGKPANKPIEFEAERQTWWGHFEPVYPDGEHLWFGISAPESDLLGAFQAKRSAITWIGLSVLLVGVLLVALLVGRYNRQLRKLPKIAIDPVNFEDELYGLIRAGESATLEFKSSMRTNLKTGKRGKEIEIAWLKAVVAFLNTDGGIVLIGINDDGEIVGIAVDEFENDDKCRLHFKNLMAQHIGLEYTKYVALQIQTVADRKVLAIQCERSDEPAFLSAKNDEAFYIRSGPSSVALPISKALKYIQLRA